MKTNHIILIAALAALTGTARANLNVVTTLPDYAAIAREIGGPASENHFELLERILKSAGRKP